MNSQPAPDQSSSANPDHSSQSARSAADAQYYRDVLHKLIDIGADLAQFIHQQAKAHADATSERDDANPGPDMTIAFDRVARAIRRTIALARTLDQPAPANAGHDAAQHRIAARRRIIRDVEDAIQRHGSDRDGEAEHLHAELLDRLDLPDLEDDIRDRPVAEIVADICRDLGLAALPGTHPYKRRTPADVASLCIEAAKARNTAVPVTLLLHTARFRGK